MKLNSDGASKSKGEGGFAGCGGLLRDHAGRWLKGYVHEEDIGNCNAIHADPSMTSRK